MYNPQNVDSLVRARTANLYGPVDRARHRHLAGALAHEAARSAASISDGSVAGDAQLMGVDLVEPSRSYGEGSHILYPEVSAEDRQKLHFGDLPDALIGRALSEITQVVPDNYAPDLVQCLTGDTLQAVCAEPGIPYEEVWTAITETGTLANTSGLTRIGVVVYGGVVKLAHEIAREYLAEQPAQLTATGA